MSGERGKGGIDLGVYARTDARPALRGAVLVASALSAVWLALCGAFFLGADLPEDLGAFVSVMVLVAVVFPLALIWVAALAVQAGRAWRADAARLEAAVDALRHAYVAQSQSGAVPVRGGDRRAEPGISAQKKAEAAVASFVPRREAAEQRRPTLTTRPPDLIAPAPADGQASLALGTPADTAGDPITAEEFIRALNFPDDEHDKAGFRALRRALEDRDAARLVRASQDVLTLLSQDGIYMDDLKPDRARPEVWRRFAEGERGRAIAALGGVRDRSSLALAAARMRQDEIFRDAAHHFLRHFDRTFAAFAAGATDQELSDLAETRTARAFMLIGRVAGTFD